MLFARSPTALTGIRLVAVDRPGFGLSARRPGHSFGDLPSDVAAVADHLGIGRFAVLGLSGGGGCAVACAYALPDRLTAVVVVSGMTPAGAAEPQGTVEPPGAALGNQVVYRLAGAVPWLVQACLALGFRATILALRRSGRLPREGMGLPFPPDVMADPGLRPLVVASLTEAVIRPGARGLVDELALYGRPWKVRLADIQTPVHWWHGDRDVTAPTAHARAVVAAIPGCHAVFVPGGHTAPLAQLGEILEPVRATVRQAPDTAGTEAGGKP